MHIPVIPFQLTEGLAFITAAAASFRGGWPERAMGAMVMFQALEAAILHYDPMRPSARLFELVHGWPVDLTTLAIGLVAVVKSDRYWTVAATASAILSLVTLAIQRAVGLSDWQFKSAEIAWYYVLVASVAVGVLTWRRGA